MTDALAKYATRSVPRYTSYPTAPHFSDKVGPTDYAAWLATLTDHDPVSLYLHVPFCRQLCDPRSAYRAIRRDPVPGD